MRIPLLLTLVFVGLSIGPAPAKQQDKTCTETAAIPATIDTIQKDFAQSGKHGPFTGIHADGTGQERVFIDRKHLDLAKRDRQTSVDVIVCWCKTGDCKNKWPVVPADADNEPDRPYACAWTNEYDTNRGHIREIETTSRTKGLAEPDWSKYPAAH